MFRKIMGWFKAIFDPGFTIEELSKRIGIDAKELKNVDLGYREFAIKKRSGKLRRLSTPNDQLKQVQRAIHRRLLAKLRVHPQATGFRRGVSFVDNARCHESQAVVISIDLVNFFPSISQAVVENYFRNIGWDRNTAALLARLTTHRGVLPQGAPTSPTLSNLVNYSLDCQIARLAERYGAVYTRYADDITLSSSLPNVDVYQLTLETTMILRRSGFLPHVGKKFKVLRQHHRQTVTGLVVNQQANLPRQKRRWLRAVEHRIRLSKAGGYLGPRPTLTEEQLQGWRSLRAMIEEDSI